MNAPKRSYQLMAGIVGLSVCLWVVRVGVQSEVWRCTRYTVYAGMLRYRLTRVNMPSCAYGYTALCVLLNWIISTGIPNYRFWYSEFIYWYTALCTGILKYAYQYTALCIIVNYIIHTCILNTSVLTSFCISMWHFISFLVCRTKALLYDGFIL